MKKCEKIDDGKEMKCGDKKKGGIRKVRKTDDVIYGRPQIALRTPAYPHVICPTFFEN